MSKDAVLKGNEFVRRLSKEEIDKFFAEVFGEEGSESLKGK